jgi:hypothetical protein
MYNKPAQLELNFPMPESDGVAEALDEMAALVLEDRNAKQGNDAPSDKLKWKTVSKELSKAHWDYIEGLLLAHGISESVVDTVAYHYTTAFQHGFEHGVEYMEERDGH